MTHRLSIVGITVFIPLGLIVALQCNAQDAPKKRDVSGGAQVQRERIDRVIRNTELMSVDDAINSLSQYNEQFELASFASSSPSSLGALFIRQVLADRRTSKIFEHLLALPANEADSKASRIFDEQFSKLHAEWESFARTPGHGNTGPCHHAASVGLLLCSYFCSRDTFDAKVHTWNSKMSHAEFDKIQGVQHLAKNRFIDPLFNLNLLVISGERHGASLDNLDMQLDQLSRKISGDAEPFLKLSKLRLFKWNGETLDTDFTHIARGVPASGDAVLIEVPGFSDPDTTLFLQNPEINSQLKGAVTAWWRSVPK